MLKNVITVLFVAVGLLNLYPVFGAISAEQLTSLYGIGIKSPDLETLMRHRAIMLGLIGGFLIVAAFRPALQVPAALIGLVSMMSFVILAFMSGEVGPEIRKVAIADIAGSIVVVLAWLLAARSNDTLSSW